jgi:hypothetical protein
VSHFKLVCIVILIIVLNFVVREMNSKMVKSRMVVLTGREKVDADGL